VPDDAMTTQKLTDATVILSEDAGRITINVDVPGEIAVDAVTTSTGNETSLKSFFERHGEER